MDYMEIIDSISKNTLVEHLGIVVTKMEEGCVEGSMPVDSRTHQPMGLLHGGATAAFAESLGSFGSAFLTDVSKFNPVGIEINCTHVKSKKSGTVFGKALLKHRGKKIHVWSIDVTDEDNTLIATARLTVMIVPQ